MIHPALYATKMPFIQINFLTEIVIHSALDVTKIAIRKDKFHIFFDSYKRIQAYFLRQASKRTKFASSSGRDGNGYVHGTIFGKPYTKF